MVFPWGIPLVRGRKRRKGAEAKLWSIVVGLRTCFLRVLIFLYPFPSAVISQPAQDSHNTFARSRRSLGCCPSSNWARRRSDARTLHIGRPRGAGEGHVSFALDLKCRLRRLRSSGRDAQGIPRDHSLETWTRADSTWRRYRRNKRLVFGPGLRQSPRLIHSPTRLGISAATYSLESTPGKDGHKNSRVIRWILHLEEVLAKAIAQIVIARQSEPASK